MSNKELAPYIVKSMQIFAKASAALHLKRLPNGVGGLSENAANFSEIKRLPTYKANFSFMKTLYNCLIKNKKNGARRGT